MRRALIALILAVVSVVSPALAKPPGGFLVSTQLPSGGWAGDGGETAHVGVSALATLALLGGGYTGRGESPPDRAVRDALRFLMGHQDAEGRFGDGALSDHALATLAMSEAAWMSRDPKYARPRSRAILHLVGRQAADGSFGDLLTTAWAGMALKSAHFGGFLADPEPAKRLKRWLDLVTDEATGEVRGHGDIARATAIGILLRILHGEDPRTSAPIARGAAICLANLASGDGLFRFFATLALFQCGGSDWKKWNESVLASVVKAQQPDGSWQPAEGQFGGRVGATALGAMALQVYYRYDRVFGIGPDADGGLAVGRGGGAGGGVRGRAGKASKAQPFHTEEYDRVGHHGFRSVWEEDSSTFSVDVDTASYANIRRFLVQENRLPPKDAVRVEEMVNYFTYDYAGPVAQSPDPLAIHVETAACPWAPDHRLLRIGLQAARLLERDRPESNLVFLLDVSGSMKDENKLPLLRRALRLLVERLDRRDRVSIVVYAGAAGLVLPPTRGSEQGAILAAIDALEAGGSTNGGAGIELAYATARANLVQGGLNRVILCTDGDFNVGISDRGSLTRRVEEEAKGGVALSILGFGMGNLKDARLEELSNRGDGNYAYIDTLNEARKVLAEQLMGTLLTVAKDAKVQLFFNPRQVASWRLIGYENRRLSRADFSDDAKDAGDIGAGHSVTALYEIVPQAAGAPGHEADPNPFVERGRPSPEADAGALVRVRLRYKPAGSEASRLREQDVRDGGGAFDGASPDFRWAAAVTMFGMLLSDAPDRGGSTCDAALEIAGAAVGEDREGYRREMLDLIARARAIAATPPAPD